MTPFSCALSRPLRQLPRFPEVGSGNDVGPLATKHHRPVYQRELKFVFYFVRLCKEKPLDYTLAVVLLEGGCKGRGAVRESGWRSLLPQNIKRKNVARSARNLP